jgi:copper homeostasis protein
LKRWNLFITVFILKANEKIKMSVQNRPLLEVCSGSIADAMIAEQAGANRIEFCMDLREGGLTPSFVQIDMLRERLNIDLFVIIRPRGGDFLYSDDEFEAMQREIRFCGKAGCDGVVTGILRADGSVDRERNARLVNLTHEAGMGITFHRAFDRAANLSVALEDVISLGFDRILTSGGCSTAEKGIDVISSLVKQAAGRISIMPGAGVTPENIKTIIEQTGAHEIHGTMSSLKNGGMLFRKTGLGSETEEYQYFATDPEKVKRAVEALNICNI